jgi:hypothetical protein
MQTTVTKEQELVRRIIKAFEDWEAACAEDEERVWHYAADGTSARMEARFRI